MVPPHLQLLRPRGGHVRALQNVPGSQRARDSRQVLGAVCLFLFSLQYIMDARMDAILNILYLVCMPLRCIFTLTQQWRMGRGQMGKRPATRGVFFFLFLSSFFPSPLLSAALAFYS